MLVEGQGGGCDVAFWSRGSPAGRHHSVSLRGALTRTRRLRALSQVVAGAEEVVFLSQTPTRTPLLELINTVYQLTY